MFNVQGSGEQFFDWSECGFSLHVPKDALLGTETCSVAVKALMAGNFQFPDSTQLISGLYAISAARVFRKPVQTTIQHCLKVKRKSQVLRMHFIKAHQTRKGMPYIFGIEEGGEFEIDSQFGSFWQTSFSNLGVVLEDQVHPIPVDDEDTSDDNDEADYEEDIQQEQEEEDEEEEEGGNPIEIAGTDNEESENEVLPPQVLPVKQVSDPSVCEQPQPLLTASDSTSISEPVPTSGSNKALPSVSAGIIEPVPTSSHNESLPSVPSATGELAEVGERGPVALDGPVVVVEGNQTEVLNDMLPARVEGAGDSRRRTDIERG